ncbi:MAG: MurR/RpiR family transcriptional regulator [Desulfobacterales bacterium]|nr:MurR/RpiR family transcriptional regulator [Desulfobacterales bacterium]
MTEKQQQLHPVMKKIMDNRSSLSPKAQILGDFIVKNPRKAVFMTIRELAAASRVSESTIVRFANQVGYEGYSKFRQALRDFVDVELTLVDRVDLSDMQEPAADRFRRMVFEEIDNLKNLFKTFDMEIVNRVVGHLKNSHAIYVVGSRLSYTLSYYMGWSLTKIRENIHILKGSDSTCVDWLTIAPPESLVVIITQSRYPNELITLGKMARRKGHRLIVITDSSMSPLIQFAHETLIAPSLYFPIIGSPTSLSCLINYLIFELASQSGKEIKNHQKRLEQSYLENDILFNLVYPDSSSQSVE